MMIHSFLLAENEVQSILIKGSVYITTRPIVWDTFNKQLRTKQPNKRGDAKITTKTYHVM